MSRLLRDDKTVRVINISHSRRCLRHRSAL